MRGRTVKLTLDDLVEVMLSHGIHIQRIEAIMADIGIPRNYIERALANAMAIFPRREVKEAKGNRWLRREQREFLMTKRN